jgi:hypothetical protein
MSAGRNLAVVAAHVRFAPKATELTRCRELPLCAISDLTRRNKKNGR